MSSVGFFGVVLLLEDNGIIALDVEQALLDLGVTSVVTISSCEAAMDWLSQNTPDAAVLDVKLRDGECVEVAQTLVVRDVPFIVHSGNPDAGEYDIFRNGHWLPKPAAPGDFEKALEECAGARRSLRDRCQEQKEKTTGSDPAVLCSSK